MRKMLDSSSCNHQGQLSKALASRCSNLKLEKGLRAQWLKRPRALCRHAGFFWLLLPGYPNE